MRPAAPLWVLLPALVLLPVLALLPGISHGGGWELVGQFAAAALRPSLDPLVLGSVLGGLAVTGGIALLGWAASLALGLVLGIASSRVVWRSCCGSAAPAGWIRRLLALPRSIHELLWGLLLLADEPLASLDPRLATDLLNLLLELASPPRGLLLSLHRPDLLGGFDRVVGLRAGRLVFDQRSTSLHRAQLEGLYAGSEEP